LRVGGVIPLNGQDTDAGKGAYSQLFFPL
jgi:hypothetical protein